MTDTRCGYVGMIGRPNVGKSTLMNHLLGMKLSITSRKPQTTRDNILGVSTRDDVQVLFVDTPGIHASDVGGSTKAMNRYMVSQALSALNDLDLAVFVVDAHAWTEADDRVLSHIRRNAVKTICALNKIDRLAKKEALLPLIDDLQSKYAFDAIMPISALKNRGLDRLITEIESRMPIGPHLFDSDAFTDKPPEFLLAESIREKIMRQLGDELPYRAAVAIERFERGDNLSHVDAVIYVERSSQKAIVIGKGGQRLKSIGQQARKAIEPMVGTQVMLNLWVKVRPGWANSDESLNKHGYR